jgi:GTP-binding protein
MVEGRRLEPLEEVLCEVEDAHTGAIIEALSLRRGELKEMTPLQAVVPSRVSGPALELVGLGVGLQ